MFRVTVKKAILGIALLTVVVIGLVIWRFVSSLHYVTYVAPPPITIGAIEGGINALRVQNGQQGFTDSRLLDALSQQRADDLCQTNTFSHDKFYIETRPQIETDYTGSAENIIYEDARYGADYVVDQWHTSPEHYANILDNTLVYQGVGVSYCHPFQNAKAAVIVVNDFAAERKK